VCPTRSTKSSEFNVNHQCRRGERVKLEVNATRFGVAILSRLSAIQPAHRLGILPGDYFLFHLLTSEVEESVDTNKILDF
jgi:hypothetical protein